jgi:two-component system response regulator HydG
VRAALWRCASTLFLHSWRIAPLRHMNCGKLPFRACAVAGLDRMFFSTMAGPRILVIDDEPGIRTTLVANLELEGFEVAEAASVGDAIDLIRAQPFDLVVSDVRMPGIDGVSGLARLREVQPELPAILITGYDAENLAADAVAKGAYTVLSKPVGIDQLVAVARSCISKPSVLVVDDESTFLETLVEGLALAGVTARRAANADEALAMVQASAVDVCVLDLVLPSKNGVELMAELRERAPGINVIAMTGHDVGELVRAVVRGGASHCLRKPFEMKVLSRMIASVRAEGGAGRNSRPSPGRASQ